jgi:hypothetical protein
MSAASSGVPESGAKRLFRGPSGSLASDQTSGERCCYGRTRPCRESGFLRLIGGLAKVGEAQEGRTLRPSQVPETSWQLLVGNHSRQSRRSGRLSRPRLKKRTASACRVARPRAVQPCRLPKPVPPCSGVTGTGVKRLNSRASPPATAKTRRRRRGPGRFPAGWPRETPLHPPGAPCCRFS